MIEKTMRERIKSWTLPVLFGSSVAYMIIKCYHNADAFMLGCVFLAYSFLCFSLFSLIKKTKKLSGILYILLFALVAAVCYYALKSSNPSMSFSYWFYGAQTADTVIPVYSFVLFFGGGFFLISVVYYFTQVIYRAFGTMLIMFFPLFIYAKRLDTIEAGDFAIVLGLYLAVLVHNRQMKSEKNSLVIFNRAYAGSIGIFVAGVVAVTMIIPKPDVTAVQEEDSNFFDGLAGYMTPDNFSDTSSNSGGQLSDRIIFTVKSEYPVYLKRQSYDYYDEKYGKWFVDSDDDVNNKIPNENLLYRMNTSSTAYVKLLSEISQNNGENSDFVYPEADLSTSDVRELRIIAKEDFTPYYVIAPLDAEEIKGTYYERTFHGEFYPLENSDGYAPLTFLREFYSYTPLSYDFMCSLNYDFDELLEAVNVYASENINDEEIYEKCSDLYTDIYYVSERFTDTSGVDSEISELALEITAGLSSPYEKAKAIEGYFEEQGFEYDAEASDCTPSEFIFKTQKGACGDFATAMTLMARSVGLHARYVEGFVVAEESEDEENTYIVREYHSHAYVEVYIPGAGWMAFEPTVSGFLNFYNEDDTTSFGEYLTSIFKIAVWIVPLAVLFIIFRKQLAELVFAVRIQASKNEKAVILCYNRIVKILSRRLETNLKTKTSAEILKLLKDRGIDGEDFICGFEKICYGNEPVNCIDKKLCFDDYKRIKRAIIKSSKRKNR